MAAEYLEKAGEILAIVGLYYTTQFIDRRKAKVNKRKDFDKSIARDVMIQEVLDEIRHRIGCDRVHIIQYSNTLEDLAGYKFKNYSIRYESIDTHKFVPIMAMYQNVPIGQHSELLRRVQQYGYTHIPYDEDSVIGSIHRAYGVKSSYKFRIGDHLVNGSLSLTWHGQEQQLTGSEIKLCQTLVEKVYSLMNLK